MDGSGAEPVLPSPATIADVIAENHVVFATEKKEKSPYKKHMRRLCVPCTHPSTRDDRPEIGLTPLFSFYAKFLGKSRFLVFLIYIYIYFSFPVSFFSHILKYSVFSPQVFYVQAEV